MATRAEEPTAPASIVAEMQRAREDFRRLIQAATRAELARRSDGTRWTEQFLFHMLLGFLVARNLRIVVPGLHDDPGRVPLRHPAL